MVTCLFTPMSGQSDAEHNAKLTKAFITVKKSILNIAIAALGFTALAAPSAFAVKNYSFGNAPNQVSCSQVAGPKEFKRISPDESPTVAVKVCYITNKETFWPTRYNVAGGYLYLVRGVAYRVKELTESNCDDRSRPGLDVPDFVEPMSAPSFDTDLLQLVVRPKIPLGFNPCGNSFNDNL